MIRFLALGDLHINGLSFLEQYLATPDDMVYRLLSTAVRYAKKNNIRNIVQLGDVFHGPNPSQADQRRLLDFIERSGLSWWMLMGNHDVQENKKHSLLMTEFVSNKLPPNTLRVFTEPTLTQMGDVPFCFLPWPHDKTLLDKNQGITCAHITLKGCRLDSGIRSKKGHEVTHKRGYWLIGDVHRGQKISTWGRYVGTPYQRTFGESLPKGFSDVQARVENGRLFVKDTFIANLPPYELVNLAVDCAADLDKIKTFDPKNLTLYKLKILGSYKPPATLRVDFPNIYDIDYGRAANKPKTEGNVASLQRIETNEDPLALLPDYLARLGLDSELQTRSLEFARTNLLKKI